MDLINTKEFTKEELLDKVQAVAENYFRSGTFFCSEAVVQTINEVLGKPYDESIVKMASGFPIGLGKIRMSMWCCFRWTNGPRYGIW